MLYLCSDKLHYEKFYDDTEVCIKDEIPFEIPETWAWCHLSDVVSILNGDRRQIFGLIFIDSEHKTKIINTRFKITEGSTLQSETIIFDARRKKIPFGY